MGKPVTIWSMFLTLGTEAKLEGFVWGHQNVKVLISHPHIVIRCWFLASRHFFCHALTEHLIKFHKFNFMWRRTLRLFKKWFKTERITNLLGDLVSSNDILTHAAVMRYQFYVFKGQSRVSLLQNLVWRKCGRVFSWFRFHAIDLSQIWSLFSCNLRC